LVGHPLIDELAFTQRLDAQTEPSPVGGSRMHGAAQRPGRIRSVPPNSSAPVLPLLAAVMCADFCAGIELDERIYHESDVVRMLHQAIVDTTAS